MSTLPLRDSPSIMMTSTHWPLSKCFLAEVGASLRVRNIHYHRQVQTVKFHVIGGPGKGMYSRLYTHVLNHHAQIDHCSALHHIYSDSSLFGIVGTSYPSLRPRELVPIMVHQLSLLFHGMIPAQELSRAKTEVRTLLFGRCRSRSLLITRAIGDGRTAVSL